MHLEGNAEFSQTQCVKILTRDQLQSRKERAVRFVNNVLEDPDRADEIEEESLEDYAERRNITLSNPGRNKSIMAISKTKTQLQSELDSLQEENEELQTRLDQILNIAAPEEDSDDFDESEEEGFDPEDED